jgi:hypothetical protein
MYTYIHTYIYIYPRNTWQVGIDAGSTCPPPTEEDCIEWPPTSKEPLIDKLIKDYEEKFGKIEDALGPDVIINDAPRRRGRRWGEREEFRGGNSRDSET